MHDDVEGEVALRFFEYAPAGLVTHHAIQDYHAVRRAEIQRVLSVEARGSADGLPFDADDAQADRILVLVDDAPLEVDIQRVLRQCREEKQECQRGRCDETSHTC